MPELPAVFRPVIVIPVYNHPATIGAMVAAVRAHGLPCLLVDDGSEPACAAVLDALVAESVHLVRLPANEGKGGAMIAGLREAARRGHTHALQIDADGQHDAADIPSFLALARERPDAIICGIPIFDESIPKVRLYGRYLTHVCVWINTLSLDIRDSMCGFRLYPLAPTLSVLDSARIGRHMDFDSDVIVRLHWRGVPIVCQATRVTYPADGISHFRALSDNALIAALHARHFVGMLVRLPLLLWRKVRR